MTIDLEWLGGGTVRVFFQSGTQTLLAHTFSHANEVTSVYMSTASLPVRYAITSTGSAGTLEQVCASVVREGGNDAFGIPAARAYFNAGLTATTTERSAFAIKLRTGFERAAIRIRGVGVSIRTAGDVLWQLYINPTMGGTLTYSNAGQIAATSPTQQNYTSGGTVVAAGVLHAGTTNLSLTGGNLTDDAIALGADVDGAADVAVLTVQCITGTEQIDTICEWVEGV